MARTAYTPDRTPPSPKKGGGLTLTLDPREEIVLRVGGQEVRITPSMVTKLDGRKAARVTIRAAREVKIWREKA